MKDLLICLTATAWVLEVIYCMGRWRHPRKGPDQIDREFRDMVNDLCEREDRRIKASFEKDQN